MTALIPSKYLEMLWFVFSINVFLSRVEFWVMVTSSFFDWIWTLKSVALLVIPEEVVSSARIGGVLLLSLEDHIAITEIEIPSQLKAVIP